MYVKKSAPLRYGGNVSEQRSRVGALNQKLQSLNPSASIYIADPLDQHSGSTPVYVVVWDDSMQDSEIEEVVHTSGFIFSDEEQVKVA